MLDYTTTRLDRKGKYSNGFCHWPQPAWVRADGSWQPTVTHFTSLADPTAVGSGHTALHHLHFRYKVHFDYLETITMCSFHRKNAVTLIAILMLKRWSVRRIKYLQ